MRRWINIAGIKTSIGRITSMKTPLFDIVEFGCRESTYGKAHQAHICGELYEKITNTEKPDFNRNFYYREAERKIPGELVKSKQDLPDVICSCGNAAFTLRYTGYRIIAKCANCGKEDSVYSG